MKENLHIEQRVRALRKGKTGEGPVVYLMSRDQRVHDNPALLFAQHKAIELGRELLVVFCLRATFEHATLRLVDFMLRGLKEVYDELVRHTIGFEFLLGDVDKEVTSFVKKVDAALVVKDFSPLKINQKWSHSLSQSLNVPLFEVDAHNIIPVWETSEKLEFAAYTIRPKIYKKAHSWLEPLPSVRRMKTSSFTREFKPEVVIQMLSLDTTVLPVDWVIPGERHARAALKKFLNHGLFDYGRKRNDPTLGAQSNLSPYLHFGHISALRVVLETLEFVGKSLDALLSQQKNNAKVELKTPPSLEESAGAFLEELIVRRELSDNFCFYNSHYDSVEGFPDWAKKTLAEHAHDPREFIYTRSEFEHAKTHDDLWNAAQNEMVRSGKMHGYMRMYWAKKILEWTKTPHDALKIALYLNDKYELDGRDPNGYAGVAWSIGGVHDRAWFDRPVFGKIRYMSCGGAKNKFDIKGYIAKFYP